MLTNLELFIEGFYFNKMSKRKLITILTKENSGHIFDNNGHYLRRELYSDFQFAGYDKELEILYDYYMFLKTLPADELFPEGIFKNKKSVSVSNNRRYVFSNYVANGMDIIVFRRLFTTEFDSAENGNLKQLFDDFHVTILFLITTFIESMLESGERVFLYRYIRSICALLRSMKHPTKYANSAILDTSNTLNVITPNVTAMNILTMTCLIAISLTSGSIQGPMPSHLTFGLKPSIK